MCEGWFIVLVHFDQLMKASRASLEDYWKDYDKFCGEVSHWEANLKKFASIKKRLRSVPLLPSLLPISAELTQTEAVELHGPPRTLYDWVCLHFLHLKAPRRPNVFPLAGTIGSSLNLAGSRAGSEVGLAARAALVTSGKTSMSPICNANSFYLSTSSPSSQTATPPVVPSLETALLEYIEDTAFRLSQVREAVGGPRRCPSSSSNGEDGNSILLSEDEDDEEQEEVESHGAHLATVYSRLKTFGELLDSAPSDTESHEAEAPPSTPSLVIPSSSYIAPFDSSECVHVGRCFTSDDAVDMRGGDVGVAASSDGRKLSWRHSRKHFSCHLNQLQKLQDQATHDQNCLQRLSEQLFLDWQRRESKYSQRHFREVLKNQEHMLSAIGTRFQGLKKTFDDVTGLKFKLAESISTLQEQIQAFSSEIHLKHRQCLRCFKDLESISTCSALLDQLRDTPELYIKCLLEIVRRRRVTDVWISINDQYSKRLAAFQRDESSRRETISRELKGHILQQIFSPLRSPRFPVATCLAPGGIRQYSRLSLVLPTPSTKRLNRGNKCLSASYLNFTPQCSSPFRLPSNRPAQAATVASARRIPQSSLDRQVDPLERSLEGLPSVSEEDLRELMPQLPEDLAHMIAVVLEEVATEGDALAFYLDAMTRGPTRRPRLLSSPCLLLRPQSPTQSPTSSSKSRCISVATSTEDGKRYFSSAERLSSIFERPPPPPPTEDKAVSVALEAASLDLSVCDSPDPRPASPPSNAAPFMSLFPPPPHSEQSSHSSLMEPSSDIYLSMDASAFESDQSADANISPPHQPLQSDTRFHSFDGSSSNESSLVAPNPHFDEALTSQRDLLKRLYADLSRILPGRFAALTLTSSPKFKPVEKSESYLGVALSTIREVLGYLEDSDAAFQTPAASTNVETPSSTSTASVQASCALVDSSTGS
uniref:ATG11 domain-containing protein n=1 Tax=Mesocestoides corti TaxID=53468 RepID=A0A5K3FS77_MESCO